MPASNKRMDKHPQFLNIRATESAPNTYTSRSVRTPVVRGFGISGEKAIVMEILKIFMNCAMSDIVNDTVTAVNIQLTKHVQTAILNVDDPEIIAMRTKTTYCYDTGTTDATIVTSDPGEWLEWDLSDGQGNGWLFAYEEIHLGVHSLLNANVKEGGAKILYRMVEVTASELLGLLGET